MAGYHFERKKNKKKRKTKKKRKEHGRRVSRLAAGHSLFCHDHALNLSEPWTSPKARVKITHLQNWTAESVGSRAAWQPLGMSFHHSDAESDMEGSKGPSFLLQTPSLIIEAIHTMAICLEHPPTCEVCASIATGRLEIQGHGEMTWLASEGQTPRSVGQVRREDGKVHRPACAL